MLYEMLTGQRAFRGETRASTIASILREEPKPISQVAEGLPREVERIVKRCLRKDPEHRFQTMADLRVALEELKEESDSGALETAEVARPRLRHRLVWAFGVVAVLVIAAVAAWFVRSRLGRQETLLTPVPLTSYAGFEYGASFSPDGNQVAFAWNGEKENNWDIYIKLIGSEPPMRLTSNKADEGWPAWSPDGRQIAFYRDLGSGKSAVVLISPLGGPERILTECHFPFPTFDISGPLLSWSPDGRALAMVEQKDPDTGSNLILYMMETGERHPLTEASKPFPCDKCPAFSPDGRTLAFCRWVSWAISDLYLLDLSRDLKPVGEPRRLTFRNSYSLASGAAWVSDGRALVYAAEGSLWRVATSGSSQPQKLTSIGRDVYMPAISHRASRLAYTHLTFDINIWRIEISSPQGKANPPTRFISSTRNEGDQQYSPDGKKIAFDSDRSGTQEIWVCGADGSNAIQLTHFGKGNAYEPRWSPDGSRLTFVSNIEGHTEVYVINASGGSPRRVTTSSGSENPSWSKDGRWIYFSSLENVIQKVPAEGGPVLIVYKDAPGFAPRESPDGKFIYFNRNGADASSWILLKAPAEGGQSTQALGSIWTSPTAYALEDHGIYFLSSPDPAKGYSIRYLELETGKIKTIAELGKQFTAGITVSPDRRWALYDQADQLGSDLMLVENFR